ncbi:putative mitochondrial protein [Tanacetum coccineum]
MEAPVLALPNFDQEFVVETNASGTGIGNVLCQNGHPIAYLSKTLAAKHQSLSTYEKEFLAVVVALDEWKGYLLDRHFKIRTDHFSLNYKKGNENMVVDALSRVNQSGELLQMAVSSVTSDVWEKVKASWKNDIDVQNLIQSLVDHSYKGNKYSWTDGVLKRKGKVVVGNDLELRKELIKYFHNEAIRGHSGVHVSTKKLNTVFYWKGLKKIVKQWVRECDI